MDDMSTWLFTELGETVYPRPDDKSEGFSTLNDIERNDYSAYHFANNNGQIATLQGLNDFNKLFGEYKTWLKVKFGIPYVSDCSTILSVGLAAGESTFLKQAIVDSIEKVFFSPESIGINGVMSIYEASKFDRPTSLKEFVKGLIPIKATFQAANDAYFVRSGEPSP